jgi:tetratricopeptide (TPR) repeat protein
MKANFLSRFTPSVMTPSALEAVFVQREKFVLRILELISNSVLTSSKHHMLLVGPRGIGKTHLISLINYRLQGMDQLKGRVVIAWLREDEWGVTSLLDLLLRVFQSFPSEVSDSNLAERIEGLYSLPADSAELAGVALLKELVGNRTLLILMENLDDLFRGLRDIGQKRLRSFLQENPFCAILATSQALFNGIALRSSPFYGFFRIRHLEELTLDDATELLRKIAELDGNSNLASFINTPLGRARVRAVHHLAGGNHRVYVIFSQFLTRESLDDLVEPLVSTLDDLTPYYQARMSWLSPQQRKIVEFLISSRHAVQVKDIAQRCFMSHQTASSQLKTLRDMGYVQSISAGRSSYYELHEPLMRLCVEIKRHRAEPIRLFIDFLRLWYSRSELEHQVSILQPDSKLDREYMLHALREMETAEDPRISACRKDCDGYIEQRDFGRAFKAAEELVAIRGNGEDWSELAHCLLHLRRWNEGLESYDKVVELNPEDSDAWGNRGWALSELGRYPEALSSMEKSLAISATDASSWFNRGSVQLRMERFEDALTSFDKAIQLDRKAITFWKSRIFALRRLKRYEDALADSDQVLQLDPSDPRLWHERGHVLSDLGRFQEGIASNERAIEINPSLDLGWTGKGYGLAALGCLDEALDCFDKAIAISDKHANNWRGRGTVLDDLGRHEEALDSFDKALKLAPKNSVYWYDKGIPLQRLNRTEEALRCYDKALKFDENNVDALINRGVTLMDLDRTAEALSSYDKAIEIAPNNTKAWLNRVTSLERMGLLDDALRSCIRVLDLEPHRADAWFKLSVLAGNTNRYESALDYVSKAMGLGFGQPAAFFNRSEALLALDRWDEGISGLDDALTRFPYETTRYAGDTKALVGNLVNTNLEAVRLLERVGDLVRLYEKHNALSALAQGVVQSIAALEPLPGATTSLWYDSWLKLGNQYPEFRLPLRLMKVAMAYCETNDDQVMLQLPVEERSILRALLRRR